MEYATSADGQVTIAQDGEFVLHPGVYPPILEAKKVTPNMVAMDNPSEEEAKKLSAEFRQNLSRPISSFKEMGEMLFAD